MEEKVLFLDNQHKDLWVGEDALDFDFDSVDHADPSASSNPNQTMEPYSLSKIVSNFIESQKINSSKRAVTIKGTASFQIYERHAGQGVPFRHTLLNPLRDKDLFILEGDILKQGLRFTINFLSGPSDIIFHLNPRLDQNYIARNSYVNEEWGEEEGFGTMKNPLQAGKPFQIQIFITEKCYMVCLNGHHMFAFNHRVLPENVGKIEIFGDINLKTASLLSSGIYPNLSLMKYKRVFDSLHIPLTHLVDKELKPGNKIEIKGKVKLLPVSFRINIQSGEQIFPHPLIVYHLNVRYQPNCYVVQNSWGYLGGQWDEEVRSPLPLSLSPGKSFEMSLYIYDSYIVAKGDSWCLPIFRQRVHLENGTCIYIQGDIHLNSFKITSFRNEEEVPKINHA